MPRKAVPHSPSLLAARQAFERYLESAGLSVNAFAKRHSLTQSTVQRFHSGRTKTLSPRVREMLRYANIGEVDGIDAAGRPNPRHARLQAALESALAADVRAAELLLPIVEAVGQLLREAASRPREGKPL